MNVGQNEETGTLIPGWCQHKTVQLLWKSLAVPQKPKQSYHMTQQFHTKVYRLKRSEHIYLYKTLYSALFMIAKQRKQPKCPSTNEWINSMYHIQTMEYLVIKRKKGFASLHYWKQEGLLAALLEPLAKIQPWFLISQHQLKPARSHLEIRHQYTPPVFPSVHKGCRLHQVGWSDTSWMDYPRHT